MNLSVVFKSLIPIDLRNIGRDSGISWMIFLPLLTGLLVRWGAPALDVYVQANYAFDITPYYPPLLGYFFIGLAPMVFSVLIGFVLLDEQDDNTLTALQVTPLSLYGYLAYRIIFPIILTIIMVPFLFPFSRLSTLSGPESLLAAVAAAPIAPMFALYLASVAQNKVQGFALMKLSGLILLLPVFAYFTAPPLEYLFGLVPTYWPIKVYWLLETGGSFSSVWPFILVSWLYQGALIWLLAKRFYKKLHQ
jgi:fluoroquinolone transport system permease protein